MSCPEIEAPQQLASPTPSPPQRGVPAFTVLQPDGPLAVLRDRAQQISVSPEALGQGWQLTGEARYPFGPQFAHLCSEGQLLVQLEHILVLQGTELGGFWWMGKDGRADSVKEGSSWPRQLQQHPLTGGRPSPWQCPLYLCPPLEALEEGGPPLTLGLEGEHQRSNAALALQLARCWLQQKDYRGKWAGSGWTGGLVGRGQVETASEGPVHTQSHAAGPPPSLAPQASGS